MTAAHDGARAGWRPRLYLLGGVLLAILAGFHLTLFDMVRIWSTSSTFNHGFLIAPIAIFMAWQRRTMLPPTPDAPSAWGTGYALANGLLWIAGELASIAFFQHAALVGLLIGACWTVLGRAGFRVWRFSCFYLYFAVPEGEFLVPYLQDWTALVLVEMLRLTGIPVFLEGRYLAIPSGNFVVAEACSGINYLLATLAVGTMFMYLNFRSPWRRAAFMLLVVAVPLVANGLRAYGIVMIAHLSDYKYAMGIDHFIYGWVFFGIVIFAVFALGSLFSDVTDETARSEPERGRQGPPVRSAALTVSLVALLGAVFLPRLLLAYADAARPLAPPIALPSVPGWSGPEPATRRLDATFAGADTVLAGVYRGPAGEQVTLELHYFEGEDEGAELVSQANALFDGHRWKQLAYAHRAPPDAGGLRDLYELELRALDDQADYLAWQWYDTSGVRSAQRLPVKLAQARARLAGAADNGMNVSLWTAAPTRDQARETLAAFLASGSLQLERLVQAPYASP